MAGQQYDPEVISFLKLRNAPLTNANYNSVLAQMQANPSMRGAPVADPSASDKTYDGGLDELNMGGDVPKAGPRPGASAPPVPQSKPAIPDNQEQHGASGSFADAPQVAEGGGSSGAGPAAAATVVGGGTVAALLAYLRGQSNGAGGAAPRVEPSGPAVGDPSVRAGLPATAEPVPAQAGSGTSQDLLAGHAPPAALPAPAADQGQKLLPDLGAGDPMVNPGVAPRSSVVPMPDNAPNGMIELFADRINKLSQAGRGPEAAQMIERLLSLVGHAHR